MAIVWIAQLAGYCPRCGHSFYAGTRLVLVGDGLFARWWPVDACGCLEKRFPEFTITRVRHISSSNVALYPTMRKKYFQEAYQRRKAKAVKK